METKVNTWVDGDKEAGVVKKNKYLVFAKYFGITILVIIILFIILFIISIIIYSFRTTPTMVLLYSPTCPHCITFKPAWDEFVRVYDGKTKEIDTSNPANYDQYSKYNADGVPTIILDNGGDDFKVYDGDKNIISLLNFASL